MAAVPPPPADIHTLEVELGLLPEQGLPFEELAAILETWHAHYVADQGPHSTDLAHMVFTAKRRAGVCLSCASPVERDDLTMCVEHAEEAWPT